MCKKIKLNKNTHIKTRKHNSNTCLSMCLYVNGFWDFWKTPLPPEKKTKKEKRKTNNKKKTNKQKKKGKQKQKKKMYNLDPLLSFRNQENIQACLERCASPSSILEFISRGFVELQVMSIYVRIVPRED